MRLDKNQQVFFELVRAGLWEREARLSQFNDIDYAAVMEMADEQSVVGLVTAGIEANTNYSDGTNNNIPKEWNLQFIGSTLQIEQQNKDLNVFLARLIEKLRREDIYALLVKGQGIAQCYEKPLWRASGDVDLLLSDTNYEKAKKVLIPLAEDVEKEFKTFKHLGMTMKGGFVVELHGTLHSRLSRRIDKVIDEAQRDVFYGGSVRPWMNGGTTVFLPSPDNDVIFVFTHILHHYYIEGIGLRQICDWCRLLWTYRESLNHELLEARISKAGLMTEWKAFASLAVEWLGMPVEAMPLFNENDNQNEKLKRKAELILEFMLECGNFGHNREKAGGKINSAWSKLKDFTRHLSVFPMDSLKFFCHFMVDGIKLVVTK